MTLNLGPVLGDGILSITMRNMTHQRFCKNFHCKIFNTKLLHENSKSVALT